MIWKWISISTLSLILTACTQDYAYEYYESGAIKVKTEIRHGLRHGRLFEYYENGDIQSEQQWIAGKMNGKFTDYYPGKVIYCAGSYFDDKRIGEWIFYDKEGHVSQIQSYDPLGNIIDVERYVEGSRDPRPYPYVYFNSPEVGDTLLADRPSTFYVKIVNVSDSLLRGDNLILTNGLRQNSAGRTAVIDTIAIILPGKDFLYKYTFIPTKEGDDRLLGLVYCKKRSEKQMEIITIGFSYPFYVRRGGTTSPQAVHPKISLVGQ